MDLRPLTTDEHIERAKVLAMCGLLNYQPYRLADDFYCGAGLSVLQGHTADPPTVLCPSLDPSLSAYAATALVSDGDRSAFIQANDRLAQLYDNIIKQTAHHLGGLSELTALDVGCNAGYFPIRFEQAGAAALGYDRENYTDTIDLMNRICGTHARFRVWDYDGSVQAPQQFDVVTSVAVLVHMSEPLRHLAWLGSSARRALLVLTNCYGATELSVRYFTVNRYYDRPFPHCFDTVSVSRDLMRLAFEKMGFRSIMELSMEPMPQHYRDVHVCMLGLR